jgi:type I restriction enzyme, S subunit
VDWNETTLGDVCDKVNGTIQTGPFGSQLHESDYSSEGIPVVMPKDIIEGRIATDTVARISPEHVARLSRHKLAIGDIVYGRRGDIGRQALIHAEQSGWLCGTGCLRVSLGASVLDPTYLHYYLRQATVIRWISNQAVGATMPNLNTAILRSVPVRMPVIDLQRQIAAMLEAYDQLIENNQQRIRILEEMARALYREWFVELRFPGHEGIARVASPLGEIPQGWEVVRATDCMDVNPRVTVPREGEKPFVPMSSLSNNSMIINAIETRGGNSGAKFQNGDTLFARITPCLENGKTGFVQFLPERDSMAFGSTEFIVLRSRTLTPEFVYCLARSDEFRDLAIKSMSGATGRQRVQERCFGDFRIAHPPRHLLDAFSKIAAPSFALIHNLSLQIEVLRRTRDLLLPRLMSGQIKLKAD